MVNFADNPQAMLELGLIERNTKRPITDWLDVESRESAFDFEKAITLRMMAYDTKREEAQAKRIARAVHSLIILGEEIDFDAKASDSSTAEVW